MIVIEDARENANFFHYTSVKSKRVTKSVLAAEYFAAVHAFDFASALRTTLVGFFSRVVPSVLYTDSTPLFRSVVGLNPTTKKRLLIELCILRQTYELQKLSGIIWIPSVQNSVDALTKHNASKASRTILNTNKVSLDGSAWIERLFLIIQKLKTREDPRSHLSA